MFELSKQFHFDSAHTLERDVSPTHKESSRRVHGHSYRAEVTLKGPAHATGMVVDIVELEKALGELHHVLDHRMLNDVPQLGMPTMENLCVWIWQQLMEKFPNIVRVTVFRDSSGERCVYRGPARN